LRDPGGGPHRPAAGHPVGGRHPQGGRGVSVAWQFYISTVLIYLGVDVIACWGLNLQFGVAGLVNFAYIIFQAAGAYTAAVLTLGPAQPASPRRFQHAL